MMAAVEAIVQKAGSKDVKERLAAIDEAAAYVASEGVGTGDAPALVDALVPGLSDNNVKVAQGALSVLLSIVTQLEEDCAPFLGGIWPSLIEKMGDAKGPVREKAVDLAMAVATLALPPAQVVERLKPAFGHKNWRARESALLCLGRVLATSEGSIAGLPLKVTLPMVLKLIEDGQPAVREACTLALEQIHRHVGDMLLGELQRREIRPTILKAVLARLQQQPQPHQPPASPRGEGSQSTPTLDLQSQPLQRRFTSPAVVARAASARAARPTGSTPGGAEAEDASDVQAIAIYSDRDFARECAAMAENLANADECARVLRVPPWLGSAAPPLVAPAARGATGFGPWRCHAPRRSVSAAQDARGHPIGHPSSHGLARSTLAAILQQSRRLSQHSRSTLSAISQRASSNHAAISQ